MNTKYIYTHEYLKWYDVAKVCTERSSHGWEFVSMGCGDGLAQTTGEFLVLFRRELQ
jgi:hypothetical protein